MTAFGDITINAEVVSGNGAVDTVFTNFGDDEQPNRATYIGTDHVVGDVEDSLILYRTFPKSNGQYKGVVRSTSKLTKSVAVDGLDGSTLVRPLKIQVETSIPVGTSPAEVFRLRNLMAKWLVHSLIDELMIRARIS